MLGILNSKLLFWKLKLISNIFRGGWIICTKQYVEILPIRTIDFTNNDEINQHNHLVFLVDHILELNKRNLQTPNDKQRLQLEIEATDAQIDRLVYELYGLTDEEISIIEGDE